MRLTVLGKSPSWQDVDGACSGYLIQTNSASLLLDCGSGVFGKLRRYLDYAALDAILISHLHADHFLDLFPYAYALTVGPRWLPPQPVETPPRPKLFGPKGLRETMRAIAGAWGPDEQLIENAFDVEEYDVNSTLTIGDLHLRFALVPHYVTTHAVDFHSNEGSQRMTFSADCRPNEELVSFARNTDLLLCEATVPTAQTESGDRGHLTPGEAGELSAQAGAKRLVLTHISDELDYTKAISAAGQAFGGPVEIATEGAVFNL